MVPSEAFQGEFAAVPVAVYCKPVARSTTVLPITLPVVLMALPIAPIAAAVEVGSTNVVAVTEPVMLPVMLPVTVPMKPFCDVTGPEKVVLAMIVSSCG